MPVADQIFLNLKLIGPSLALMLGGCLILCASVFVPHIKSTEVDQRRNLFAAIATLFLAVAAFLHFIAAPLTAEGLVTGLFRFDQLTVSAVRLTLIGGLLLFLISWSLAPKNYLPEFYGCMLLILSAIPLVAASNDLIVLFLTLELISIPTYILLNIVRGDNVGLEAGLKYFTLSAFSSCFFLLGCSFLYGLTGSMDLGLVQATIASGAGGKLGLFAISLVLVGLSFRITSVPFHSYAPDVFEGTTITMAATLSYLPKLAGFIALMRLFAKNDVGYSLSSTAVPMILFVAAVTMCLGNALAVAQTNIRRILAYSSIAHTGYLLLGLAAILINDAEVQIMYTYLAAYAAMTIGVFACLAEIESAGGRAIVVGDLSGMFFRRPAASIAMSICLLSLIGLPLTAGFFAKLFLFFAAGSADRWDMNLVVWLMAFNAAIAASYYFRMLSKLYERDQDFPPLRIWRPTLFLAYSLCAVLTIVWFFQPTAI